MKISVIGAGYVGLVTATGMAEMGHTVICAESDDRKRLLLQAGKSPIHEVGLEEAIKECQRQSTLSFVKDIDIATKEAELIFIAVGTPSADNGSADLDALLCVASEIAQALLRDCVIAVKSTVPVGTAEQVEYLIRSILDSRGLRIKCSVISNPEFLKEGTALSDFRRPDRIVIGSNDPDATRVAKMAYSQFLRRQMRIVEVSRESAELGKYAANAMLASRISLMNQLSTLAEYSGADIEEIRLIVGSDKRIGPDFLYAGPGFGGSCFPKDLRALSKMGDLYQRPTDLIDSILAVNERQKMVVPLKLAELLNLPRKTTCTIWGLSFKPDTDDVRDAPSIDLINYLLDQGVSVQVYDPVVKSLDSVLSSRLVFFESQYEATVGAEALVLMTEWKIFRNLDFHLLSDTMSGRILCDARNIWNREDVIKNGFRYYGLGR